MLTSTHLNMPSLGRERAISPLAPSFFEIAALIVLVLFYLFSHQLFGEAAYAVANVLGPIAFTMINGIAAYWMVRVDRRTLFTPLFTYRVGSGVYFGLGQMVHMIVSEDQLQAIESLYLFSAAEVATMNLLIAYCGLAVTVVCRMLPLLFSHRPWLDVEPRGLELSSRDARVLMYYGLGMLIVGSVVKYLIVFPVNMGWLPAGYFPGFLFNIAEASLIGINLLTIWTLRFAPRFFPILCGVVIIEVLYGILIFSKVAVLLPLLMLLTGVMLNKVTWTRIVVGLATFFFIVDYMQPMVGFARLEYGNLTRNAPELETLETRAQVIQEYFNPTRPRAAVEEKNEGVLRFSYVNAGTYAIAMYDQNWPGESYRYLFVSLVPRILWPDKPLLQEGGEFTTRVTGREAHSSTSPGLYPEAYWNFGWLGVPVIGLLLGLFLVAMSRYTLWVFGDRRWMYMPIALIGMKVGLSIDGMFVGLISGSVAIIVGLHFVTYVVERTLDSRDQARYGQ